MDNLTSNTTWMNVTNRDSTPQFLKTFASIVNPILLCMLMFCMACGISLGDLKHLIKRPFPALIGLLSQFVVMPACAFGYAHALSLSPLHSIALLVVSSCPGGAISNVFTYWTRGDLALSIFMTLVSTILALAFMPLNMFLYLRQWTDEDIKIPFVQNVLVILMTWIPVTIGLVVRHKSARIANGFAKIGGVVNMLFIILVMIVQNIMSPKLFFLSATSWVAGATFPVIGFGVGFLISCVACLQINQCKTVAFETGIQNIAVALTLFTLSFDVATTGILMQIPLVFAFGQLAFGFFLTFLHRIYYRVTDKGSRATVENENEDVETDDLQKGCEVKETAYTVLPQEELLRVV